ncbi:MAG: transposase [Candidatus Binatia bacterium]
MGENSRSEGIESKEIVEFNRETIEEAIRARVRSAIERILAAELDEALGAQVSERVGEERKGYRHGHRERTLTTSTGPATFSIPRARRNQAEGGRQEWRSRTIGRYERVDEGILGVYLSGANTRRIRGALAPLLRGAR